MSGLRRLASWLAEPGPGTREGRELAARRACEQRAAQAAAAQRQEWAGHDICQRIRSAGDCLGLTRAEQLQRAAYERAAQWEAEERIAVYQATRQAEARWEADERIRIYQAACRAEAARRELADRARVLQVADDVLAAARPVVRAEIEAEWKQIEP